MLWNCPISPSPALHTRFTRLLFTFMPQMRFSTPPYSRSNVSTSGFILRRAITSLRHPTLPPFPVVESCPDPTCPCSSMPTLNQEIDHKSTLNGTISAHSQHLIISTGRHDWSSRIEDESDNGTSWGKVTGDLKSLLGRKGEFHDVCYYNLS